MAFDFLYQHLTDSIASLEHYYPCDIYVGHHQLRNLISTQYDGKIIYVHDHDVYVLDLTSQERSILTTIPFEARCLAAQHGWICVGGAERGHCAFIYIGEGDAGTISCYSLHTDAVGGDIVNSFTIHRIRSKEDSTKDEIMAIASNNDHSVSIYSLTKQVLLATRDFPKSMNYATLSPDGKIMAAVGDENKIYFLHCDLSVFSEVREDESEYDNAWRHLCAPDVPTLSLPQVAGDQGDYSFAIAFSQSGQLCAASSEAGIITLFDMDMLKERPEDPQNAIISAFRSSREGYYGYVRSMAFSPPPWDMLAWCESFGTVGLADVRQNCVRRQHLNLTRDPSKTVSVTDVTPGAWRELKVEERQKQQHQQRMQALRGHPPVGARILNDGRPESRMDHQTRLSGSFSDRERSLLQALETPTGEQRAPAALPAPFSVNYTSHPQLGQSTLSRARRDYEVQLLNPASTMSTRGPRRRSSVVLSEPRVEQTLIVQDGSRLTMTASPAPMAEDHSIPPMSTNDLTPSAGASSSQPSPYDIPPSDAWHVFDATLIRARRHPQIVPGGGAAGLSQVDDAIRNERQLSSRLERQLELERQLAHSLSIFLEVQRELQLEPEGVPLAAASPSRLQALTELSQREGEAHQRRIQELQEEVRANSRMITRLTIERTYLVEGYRTSSQTGQPGSTRLSAPSTLQDSMESLVDDHRARRQRTEQLEQQVQEAHERVDQAISQQIDDAENGEADPGVDVSDDGGAEAAERTADLAPGDFRRLVNFSTHAPRGTVTSPSNATSTRRRPVSAARTRSRPFSYAISSRTTQGQPANDHASPFGATLRFMQSTIPTASELANRITPADRQLGRWMFGRDPPATTPSTLNPDWAASSLSRIHHFRLTPAAQDEILREAGLGTAGLGWTSDGTKLFVGSERGIFEFAVNLLDRMQSPDLEFR